MQAIEGRENHVAVAPRALGAKHPRLVGDGAQPIGDGGRVGDENRQAGPGLRLAVLGAKIAGEHERSPEQGNAAGVVGQRLGAESFGQAQGHAVAVAPLACQLNVGAGLRDGGQRGDGLVVDRDGKPFASPGRAAQGEGE